MKSQGAIRIVPCLSLVSGGYYNAGIGLILATTALLVALAPIIEATRHLCATLMLSPYSAASRGF